MRAILLFIACALCALALGEHHMITANGLPPGVGTRAQWREDCISGCMAWVVNRDNGTCEPWDLVRTTDVVENERTWTCLLWVKTAVAAFGIIAVIVFTCVIFVWRLRRASGRPPAARTALVDNPIVISAVDEMQIELNNTFFAETGQKDKLEVV